MTKAPPPPGPSTPSAHHPDDAASAGDPSSAQQGTAAAPSKLIELRGTVRIAPPPKTKQFGGVWLERADGSRWIIDYRAAALWRWFADREVVVTGECYSPQGHAIIRMTHFRVATLRPAVAERGRGPYLTFGAEQLLQGELSRVAAPAGSKLAGTSRTVFRADDGSTYTVVGEYEPTQFGRVSVRARVLEPDMSHHARTDGPDLWIVDIVDGDPSEAIPPDPSTACP